MFIFLQNAWKTWHMAFVCVFVNGTCVAAREDIGLWSDLYTKQQALFVLIRSCCCTGKIVLCNIIRDMASSYPNAQHYCVFGLIADPIERPIGKTNHLVYRVCLPNKWQNDKITCGYNIVTVSTSNYCYYDGYPANELTNMAAWRAGGGYIYYHERIRYIYNMRQLTFWRTVFYGGINALNWFNAASALAVVHDFNLRNELMWSRPMYRFWKDNNRDYKECESLLHFMRQETFLLTFDPVVYIG